MNLKYDIRKVEKEDRDSVQLLTDLRATIFDPSIRGPATLMADRFERYPGALIAYHESVPVGFRTYAPVDERFIAEFRRGTYGGHIDLDHFLAEDSETRSPYFHLLSMGILQEHRVWQGDHRTDNAYPLSHQFIERTLHEALAYGARFLTGISANHKAEGMFSRLTFVPIHRIEEQEVTLFQVEIGDREKLRELSRALKGIKRS